MGGRVHPYVEVSVGQRILGFGTSTLVTLLTPLVVLPVIATVTDASGWAALAVGQSTGSVFAILVAFGWPIMGPVELARSSREAVGTIFYESLVTRGLLLLAVVVPVVAVCCLAAPPGHAGLASATGVAFASTALTSSWVAVGLGSVSRLILLESIPRLVVLVVAALVILRGGSLYVYPVAIAGASVVGAFLFARSGVRPRRTRDRLLTSVRRRLRTQTAAAATALSAAAYSAGALLLVGLSTSVHQTALMSSAQLIYSVGLYVVVALSSALQAWVVQPDPEVARERRGRALLWHGALGLLGLTLYASLAPTVATVLFGSDLAPGYAVALAYGVAFAAVCVGTSLAQHFLVPASDVVGILWATVAGALVGVPALLLLARQFGAVGGASALAASELAVLAMMAIRVRRSPERSRREPGYALS
jgi:O-antigen/teichoic acid export membrane protein